MKVFKKKVYRKLEEMKIYLNDLDNLLPDSFKEYVSETKTIRACEKTIELAIEAVISIISMIVSQEKLGIPDSEDDLIDFVSKKNIISKDVAREIKAMKGFRNILVHKYGEVDDARVYSYLSEERGDFSWFEKEINRYLRNIK